ncbi:MAG TPA: amino acid adenylation domain-containing protein [Polyangiaceae bacterium]|jgi:amino acid adenylation domain-containing protein|nr:amino acid adenylation domain-containing protein [Polyangiaceae bacterium]
MNQPLAGASSRHATHLALPFDFHRLPGDAPNFQTYVFSLPAVAGEDRAARLTATFAALLARYSGQAALALRASRPNGTDGKRSSELFLLDTSQATTARELIELASAALDAAVKIPQQSPAQAAFDSAGGRAAIAWLDASFDAPAPKIDGLEDADLTLALGQNGHAAFVFDAGLFKPSSVERFAGHLTTLLTQLDLNLDQPTPSLPLFSPAEAAWLDSVCDGGPRTLPESALVHARFEQHAAIRAEAIALRFREQTLSYRELNQRANQFAAHLIERNIGANDRVVVCVEPSFEIAIALFGILKAGAIYVPLDPTYPRARKHVILDDVAPKLVVTQAHLQSSGDFDGFPSWSLADLAKPELARTNNPAREIAPDQPAYVYYTSGTTGAPKGVLGTQANLRHYLQSAERRYGLDERDVMPAIARFSFSISMFELLLPLCAGGTLIILERDHVLDPARMARTLSEVSIFHAGPSLLRGLTAYIRRHYSSFEAFARVRHASSGGDMVPPELLETLREIFVNAEVFVIYGCSEISCMGCTYPVPRDRPISKTYVGRPFEGVIVRVLDDAGRVLPAGIVGEIHFAGAGLTHGYLNRPELTAEKFVTREGKRFYRTGDRGRLSEDGWLEILGRNDFQIKLRGMRVELAEVEHALRHAPGVREAVAAAKESADGEKILVAYYVPDVVNGTNGPEKTARVAAIRQHLSAHLPDYMQPSAYVELSALPLNHNLKVDRRALPDLREEDLRSASSVDLREPQTNTEKTLAAIWQRALGVRKVGLDDNFFELGGHSMLAVTMSLELEEALGVRLEGMDLLREPLEILAAICDARLGVATETRARARPAPLPESLEVFHFGRDRNLYGVLRGSARDAERAALICAPVGQEQVRARFVLTRLAKGLARRGVPTMIFDYFGTGDSLGESRDASIARWLGDIRAAHSELEQRTNGARVSAIGARLGALLLCQAATHLEFERIALWDPVTSGAELERQLDAMHRRYLRGIAELRFWRWPRFTTEHERLGLIYSETAWRELHGLRLAPLLREQRAAIHWLETAEPTRAARLVRETGSAQTRIEQLDVDCGWQDVARLEDVLPDTHISERLIDLITESK